MYRNIFFINAIAAGFTQYFTVDTYIVIVVQSIYALPRVQAVLWVGQMDHQHLPPESSSESLHNPHFHIDKDEEDEEYSSCSKVLVDRQFRDTSICGLEELGVKPPILGFMQGK